MTDYKNISVKKIEASRAEITGEISADKVRGFEDKALGHLGGDFALPGFRPGHVPAKMVKEKVGEVRVWIEAGEMALEKEYPKIIEAAGLSVLGQPEVQITKLAPGNPLGFKITVSVMPETKLPDYKKITKEVLRQADDKKIEVTDKEVEDLILDLQKARARHEKVIKEKSQHEGQKTQETEQNPAESADADRGVSEAELPPFDDEFAKSLGKFEGAEDFKAKAKENILEDKKFRAREKARLDIVDKIIEDMKAELPDVLVEGELHRMVAQFEGDISRAGFSFQDYLKHAGKSEDDLKNDWKSQAEKRARTQLVLLEIAKKEGLKPDKAKTEEGVRELLAQHKDADEKRVRAYVEEALLNEAALEFLENL
ncbi:MAG: trigger factor [Patescibacteria group bacterium]